MFFHLNTGIRSFKEPWQTCLSFPTRRFKLAFGVPFLNFWSQTSNQMAIVSSQISRFAAINPYVFSTVDFSNTSRITAPHTNSQAREGEASRSESEKNNPTSRTPGQRPIISVNGRNIVDEENIERRAQPNGAPAGNHGRANALSDEERQDAMSEDEKLPTRRANVGHASRPQPNGVLPNGLPAYIDANRRDSAMEPDN